MSRAHCLQGARKIGAPGSALHKRYQTAPVHTWCLNVQTLVASELSLTTGDREITALLANIFDYFKGQFRTKVLAHVMVLFFFTDSTGDSPPAGTLALFKHFVCFILAFFFFFSVFALPVTRGKLFLLFTHKKLQHREPFKNSSSNPVLEFHHGSMVNEPD